MITRPAALILLRVFCLIQSSGGHRDITSVERELGGNVTFSCPPIGDDDRFFNWYKQSFGKMIQTVAAGVYGDVKLMELFNNSRFRIHSENNEMLLTISSVNKEDEAVYFCQSGTEFDQTFSNGSFLVVKDCSQQTAVYVKQTPDTTEIQRGKSAILQCLILFKNKESHIQCPATHSVYWFRAGSGNSYPSIVHTHRNSSDEDDERRCVYHLSKTLHNSSDYGTYYCAVVSCGEMLFGKGTEVNARSGPDPITFVLGGLLFCSLTVIFLLLYFNGKRDSDHSKETKSVSQCSGHKSAADQSNDLDGHSTSVKYVLLDLSTVKLRYERKRKEYKRGLYSSIWTDS